MVFVVRIYLFCLIVIICIVCFIISQQSQSLQLLFHVRIDSLFLCSVFLNINPVILYFGGMASSLLRFLAFAKPC